MTRRLARLQSEHSAAVEEMNAISEAAEDRDLTEEETEQFDAALERSKRLKADIGREQARMEAEKSVQPVATGDPKSAATSSTTEVEPSALRLEEDPRRGFRSHREFLIAVIDNAGLRDPDLIDEENRERLGSLAVMDKEDRRAAGELAYILPGAFAPPSMRAAAGSDEQGEYADRYGGFAVPTTRIPGLLQVGFEGDPTAGLTQMIPMATPSVEIMARTDKDHSSSVSGGFTVTRRPETVAGTSSRMELEMVTLKASSLFGLAYATEELLADSVVSFIAIIEAGFRDQFGAHVLNEKIRGVGGNEYLGILNSDAEVQVAKETNQEADTIVFDNVNKMAARSWGYGSAVWVANHDTRPQLAKIALPVGTGGVAMYQPASVPGALDMLMGRPVVYTEYASTLGDVGDISLVNFTQYLEGVYEPIQSASSVHVRFVNHERTFKLWTRNAGAPWWRAALTPAESSDTLSPIVTLAARA